MDGFRQILRASGGVISGSAALQFLDRRNFDETSDLDIYVPYKNAPLIANWLLHHGFNENIPEHPNIDVLSNYNHSTEIKHVTNFSTVDSVRIIQVISTRRDPAFAILDFHSSMLLSFFCSP